MALLEVKNLGISFGGLRAVDNLNMSLEKGSLVGLIGPNGAGKTTAFNLLTGVYRPWANHQRYISSLPTKLNIIIIFLKTDISILPS